MIVCFARRRMDLRGPRRDEQKDDWSLPITSLYRRVVFVLADLTNVVPHLQFDTNESLLELLRTVPGLKPAVQGKTCLRRT